MYNALSDAFNALNKEAYDDYVRNCVARLKSDPKSFWKFVDMKRKCIGLPRLMTWGDKTASGHCAIADLMADFFASVYSIEQDVNDFDPLRHFPKLIRRLT